MQLATHRIELALASVSEEQFYADDILQAAIERFLFILGEAAKRLPEAFREAHPQVAWSEIAGLRDVLAHSYSRISLLRIWFICVEDVPTLRKYLDEISQGEP